MSNNPPAYNTLSDDDPNPYVGQQQQYNPYGQAYGSQPPQYGAQQPQYAPQQYGAQPNLAYQGGQPPQIAYAQQPYGQQPQYGQQQFADPTKPPTAYQDPNAQGQKFVDPDAYRDPIWAVLFVLHLIVLMIAGFALFGKYKDQLTANGEKNQSSSEMMNGDLVGAIIILVLLTLSFAWGWIWTVRNYASNLIYITLAMGVAVDIFFAIVMFAAGSVVSGVLFIIFAALAALYFYMVRNRIAFASVMLEVVAGVISMFSATVWYALGSALVQGVWMILWVLAAASCIYAVDYGSDPNDPNTSKNTRGSSGAVGAVYFFLLISFYWTSQVVKNVVHVTTAGTVASWYFLFPNQMPQNPTNKSFKRAVTTSFGSICLGSLIIAVIKAIRHMAQSARNSNNDFARACALCIISCIENMIQYFNQYAFTQVAIYGKTYCEAAKSTWDLIRSRGVDMIINDDLIGGTLIFGAILGALLMGAIGALLGKYAFGYHDNWSFFAVVGVLIGMSLSVCAFEVVESGVSAMFVCLAEDPQALADTKPEVYNSITNAMRQFYPSCGVLVQQPVAAGY